MSQKVALFLSILTLVIVAAGTTWVLLSPNANLQQDDRIKIAVSIAPQKTFVEAIGGEEVAVTTLVPTGADHEIYEPSPGQLAELSEAQIYFTIGLLPFENTNLSRIRENNSNLKIVNTSEYLPLRQLENHSHEFTFEDLLNDDNRRNCTLIGGYWDSRNLECYGIDADSCNEIGGRFDECASPCKKDPDAESCMEMCQEICSLKTTDSNNHMEESDPHIWLDPMLVQQQSRQILDALIAAKPLRSMYFQQNYDNFISRLNQLDKQLYATLSKFQGRTMYVFHPSFGYMADRYNFTQEYFEVSDKELSTSEIAGIVREMKAAKAKVIFVEAQTDSRQAELIASEIGGRVEKLDPMSENYFDNLNLMATLIANSYN